MSFWNYVSDALVTFWVNDENVKLRRHADGVVQPDVADTAASLVATRIEAEKLAPRLRRHAEGPTGSCTFRRWVRALPDLSSLQEPEEPDMVRPFHACKCCAKGDRQPARAGFEPP